MLKEQMNKALKVFKVKDEKNNKKKIENLVIFVIILIVTIIVINMILKDDKKNNNTEGEVLSKKLAKSETIEESNVRYEENLEKQLEEILSKIDGVGKTKVLITYSKSSEVIPLYNEDSSKSDTQEEDSRRRKQKNNRSII